MYAVGQWLHLHISNSSLLTSIEVTLIAGNAECYAITGTLKLQQHQINAVLASLNNHYTLAQALLAALQLQHHS